MEYTFGFCLLALNCIFQRVYSDSHLCDVRQWYLKVASDGLFDAPLTPAQETVQYEIEDLMFQSRKDPSKKKIECVLLQQFEEILKSKGEQASDTNNSDEESEVDETDILEDEPSEDEADNIDDPDTNHDDQNGEIPDKVDEADSESGNEQENTDNTIDKLSNSKEVENTQQENNNDSIPEKVETYETKQHFESNDQHNQEHIDPNTGEHTDQPITSDTLTGNEKIADVRSVQEDNRVKDIETVQDPPNKNEELSRSQNVTGKESNTPTDYSRENKIPDQNMESKRQQEQTEETKLLTNSEAITNIQEDVGDSKVGGSVEKLSPRAANELGVEQIKYEDNGNTKEVITKNAPLEENDNVSGSTKDNTVERNEIQNDANIDRLEKKDVVSVEQKQMENNDKAEKQVENDMNYFGTCRRDTSSPADIFLSRYFPHVTNESLDPLPCNNCGMSIEKANSAEEIDKTEEKDRFDRQNDKGKIDPQGQQVQAEKEILEKEDKIKGGEGLDDKNDVEDTISEETKERPSDGAKSSTSEDIDSNKIEPNDELKKSEEQKENDKANNDVGTENDWENEAGRRDRVEERKQADHQQPSSDPKRRENIYHKEQEHGRNRRTEYRGVIHEDIDMLKAKTFEYSDKIQSLEILIMRLENQLLMEKLDKQNHTGTITRLENSILKLENEILRLNQSHYDLVLENELMQKQKKTYLELDHVPQNSSKPTSKLNSQSTELITQQQNKITQLAELLKNQSKAIHQMKTNYEYLEDQNRMLFQMIMNQSSLMTQMMARVQELSDQNIQQRLEAQKLKEKLASSLSTLNDRKERKEMSEMSMKLMEKLDSIVSDKKLDMVEETNEIKVDVPKLETRNKRDLEDEADIKLKEYLRKTKQLADITQNWCGKHRMICVYKSIRLSSCVPFVPLYWSACEARRKGKSVRPRMEYGHDRRKALEKQEEIEDKITADRILGGNKANNSKVTKNDIDDSKSAFVQGSENKIVQVSSNTESEPKQNAKNEGVDIKENVNTETKPSNHPNNKNKDKNDRKQTEETTNSNPQPPPTAPNTDLKPEVKHIEDAKQQDPTTNSIDKPSKSEIVAKQKQNAEANVDEKRQGSAPKQVDAKDVESKVAHTKQESSAGDVEMKNITESVTNEAPSKLDASKQEKQANKNKPQQLQQKDTKLTEEDIKKNEAKQENAQIKQQTKSTDATTKKNEVKQENPNISKPAEQKENIVTETKKPKPQKEVMKEKIPETPRKIKYEKNGQTEPKDCYDYYQQGQRRNAVYKIKPYGLGKTIQVYCDMKQGGWTLIQKRSDGTTKFFREWVEYKNGFGGLYGEHWIGNDYIHFLTNQDNYKLRIDLTDWNKEKKYAEYNFFSIDNEKDGYKLTINGYSGDAGDGMAKHNGHKFSTKDVDNDKVVKEFGGSCANRFSGAWWYYKCYMSNLNGVYYRNGQIPPKLFDGITWKPWTGSNYSLRSVEMKIKPSSAM